MKKIFLLILLVFFLNCNLSVYADEIYKDELAEKLPQNLTKARTENILLQDELTDKLVNIKSIENYTMPIYSDNCIKRFADKEIKRPEIYNKLLEDTLVSTHLSSNSKITKPKTFLNNDYTNLNRIKIPIKIRERITSRTITEGDTVEFYTTEKVNINKSLTLPLNTIVHARVENVSPNEIRGVPAHIVVENFSIKNFEDIDIYGRIEKAGANRYYWSVPLTIAFLPLYGIGAAFVFVRGGHAKITPMKTYYIYHDIK